MQHYYGNETCNWHSVLRSDLETLVVVLRTTGTRADSDDLFRQHLANGELESGEFGL